MELISACYCYWSYRVHEVNLPVYQPENKWYLELVFALTNIGCLYIELVQNSKGTKGTLYSVLGPISTCFLGSDPRSLVCRYHLPRRKSWFSWFRTRVSRSIDTIFPEERVAFRRGYVGEREFRVCWWKKSESLLEREVWVCWSGEYVGGKVQYV